MKRSVLHTNNNIKSNNQRNYINNINNAPTTATTPNYTSISSYLQKRTSPPKEQQRSPTTSKTKKTNNNQYLKTKNPYLLSILSQKSATNLENPPQNQFFNQFDQCP